MSGKPTSEVLRYDAAGGGIARAAALLRAGRLVVVPTETVYGLAARADDEDAVAGIYRAKGRPDFNPLIVHVASPDAARRYGAFDERAERLARLFWPGPLTMVLPRMADCPVVETVTAGLPTIALRMPAHPAMLALLDRLDMPLAAPSANASGLTSPTRIEHALASLDGRADAFLDAGPCERGLESTIIALREDGSWQLLRPGPIPQEVLAEELGPPASPQQAAIEAPGQLLRHYSPGKPVRLAVSEARPDEFLLGFGPVSGDYSLSDTGDLAQAAARLFAGLHRAAASGRPGIAVAPIPDHGIGSAINDRLRRAAA